MSQPITPAPARPFASFLYVDENCLDEALGMMDDELGARCHSSEPVSFDRTDYYEREMGGGIMRVFAAWKKLIDPVKLIDIKKISWDIEEELKGEKEGRNINIDPGLIEEGRFVLATGKPAAHRPYLGEGVYVDLTLVYERKSYRPLAWTYPDYADDAVIEMLNELRAGYLKDRKNK